MKDNIKKTGNLFSRFSEWVMHFTGSPKAFFIAFATIIIWSICGPIFHFSDTWQLVINTSTTIITFLMVFIIQQSQNRDTLAIHLKLNELIAANGEASNRLVCSEDLTEEELRVLKEFYTRLSALSRDGQSLHQSHSIDEAESNHKAKSGTKGRPLRNPETVKCNTMTPTKSIILITMLSLSSLWLTAHMQEHPKTGQDDRAGMKGATGVSGSSGPSGLGGGAIATTGGMPGTGRTGTTGWTGSTAPTGYTGASGHTGQTGPTGITGPTGRK